MILKDMKDWFGFGWFVVWFFLKKKKNEKRLTFNGCCSTAKHWIKD